MTGTDGEPTTDTTYVVGTPSAHLDTTTFTSWSGSSTKTLSTTVRTVTGTDGEPTTETTYVVGTPSAHLDTPTFTSWRGSSTKTLSTTVRPVTGTDGEPPTPAALGVRRGGSERCIRDSDISGFSGGFAVGTGHSADCGR